MTEQEEWNIDKKDKLRLIGDIVNNLNLLASDLPVDIHMITNKKQYSDQWLKDNEMDHLINMREKELTSIFKDFVTE